jgi:uncharacterized protein with von Willebrand factor type A (vWA) domain
MAVRYRYSEWDGTQAIPDLEASEILDALSDDLMNFGDLQHALRNLMQRGMRSPQGDRMQGLRDLLQQLRQQRRQRLDQFDLGGILDDIRQQLEEILELERSAIDDRIGPPPEAADRQPGGGEAEQTPPGDNEGRDGEAEGEPTGGQRMPGQQQASGAPSAGSMSQQSPSGGPQQPADPSQTAQGGGEEELTEEEQFQQMLERIAQRKRDALDNLPPDPAGQMQALQNYEFLNPEAQHKFQELVEQLRQQMTQSFFNDIEKMVDEMSDGDMQRMKDMVRDLNEMLAQRMRGDEPDFDGFMDKYGDMFGENPPQSLDELLEQMQAQMQAMQSLMESMPSDQRQQLQGLMADKFGDAELEAELSELAQNLDFLNPNSDQSPSYPFRGDEGIDFEAAMRLMDEMHDIDDLERDLERAQYTGELEQVDLDQLRELLGDDAVDTFDELKQLLEVLENAGYIRKEGDEWELTPRGTRMIGQNALQEIYRQLKHQGIGDHPLPEVGRHGERLDDSKEYEFGDPFHLDMNRTIMNALEREGPGSPVNIEPNDFEIYRSEQVTQTATVLMVDLSWSMALRGSFQAAKKVALALQNLIKQQYPRDSLYIIGFSAYARELKSHELPYVRWDESVLGTNMHHALMLAEQMLAKHRVGSRQILMISDGEPTAHLERGRSQFAYPPSPVTIRETLKAVKRVTEQGITINTFMLDRNYYLKEFVNQLAKINGGRVFYSTPDKLGEYMLVDYVQHKRRKLNAR